MKENEMLKDMVIAKEKQIYQLSTLLNIFQTAGFVIKGFPHERYGDDFEMLFANAVIKEKEYRDMLKPYYVSDLIQDEKLRKVLEYAFSKDEVTYDDIANEFGDADLAKEFEKLGDTPEWIKDIAENQFKFMVLNLKLTHVQKEFGDIVG